MQVVILQLSHFFPISITIDSTKNFLVVCCTCISCNVLRRPTITISRAKHVVFRCGRVIENNKCRFWKSASRGTFVGQSNLSVKQIVIFLCFMVPKSTTQVTQKRSRADRQNSCRLVKFMLRRLSLLGIK